jgi:hypothetical protein
MIIWINGAFGAGKTTALSLRKHHAGTLIAPMTLINDDYLAEILGGRRAGGAEILHDRVLVPDDPARDRQTRDFCLRNAGRGRAGARWARCCCALTS